MKRKIFIMIIVLMSMSQMTAQNKILKEESNGTKWYLISHNGVYGIEDATGKVIAPLSAGYDSVFYFSFRTDFGLQKNKNYPVWGARKVINGVPMYALCDNHIGTTGLRYRTIFSGKSNLPQPVLYPKSESRQSQKLYKEIVKNNPSAQAYYNKGLAFCINNKSVAYDDFLKVLGMGDCSLELANMALIQMEAINFRREASSGLWHEIISGLPELTSNVAQFVSDLSNGSSEDSTDDSALGGGGSSSKSGNKSGTQKNNHSNWKALDSAYGEYENHLIQMKGSGNVDRQEVKNIQRKMKDIRRKIKEQSGHDRNASPLESWNP